MDLDEYLHMDMAQVTPRGAHNATGRVDKLAENDKAESQSKVDPAEGLGPMGVSNYKPISTIRFNSKFSEFGSEILAGFSNPGSSLNKDLEQRPVEQAPGAGQLTDIEDGEKARKTFTPPAIRVEAAGDSNDTAEPKGLLLVDGKKEEKQLRLPNRDASFLYNWYSSDGDNLDGISTASDSPYIHPDDKLSPTPGYLCLDSDVDELLSVHSDLSEVSKEYEYVSNISELNELLANTNSMVLDFEDSQFEENDGLAQFGEDEMVQDEITTPALKIEDMNSIVTPPRIKIEHFESTSRSTDTQQSLSDVNSVSPDLSQHEMLTSDSSMLRANEQKYGNRFPILLKSQAGQPENVLPSQQIPQEQSQLPTSGLLSVNNLSTGDPSDDDEISRTFDEMLQGRKNRNRSNSRSRSTSRRRAISRSTSPDERSRSLSKSRDDSMHLEESSVSYERSALDEGESTLNLIGKTKKKLSQKHPAVYGCQLCDKKFTRPYNLKSHLRSHTDERPFVCTLCGKAFARLHDKKRHEDLHSGKKRYVCGGTLKNGDKWGCGKKFARSDALGRHFKTGLGKKCISSLYEEAAMEKLTTTNADS